jgi:hypothetical protein
MKLTSPRSFDDDDDDSNSSNNNNNNNNISNHMPLLLYIVKHFIFPPPKLVVWQRPTKHTGTFAPCFCCLSSLLDGHVRDKGSLECAFP